MWTRAGCHVSEEVLEKYSMNRLSPQETESVEEHLLVCPACQDKLDETDVFIKATRRAAARLAQEERPTPPRTFRAWRRLPIPVWATVSAAGLVLLLWWPLLRSGRGPEVDVSLHATRGIEGVSVAHAPASRLLALRIDASELPRASAYQVDLVGLDGAIAWRGEAGVTGDMIVARPGANLRPGRYWLRLFAGDGSGLLREFALEVR